MKRLPLPTAVVVLHLTLALLPSAYAAVSPHTDYRPGYASGCGNTAACHIVIGGAFLPDSLDKLEPPNENDYTAFCISCHNTAGEAHEKVAGSPSTNVYVSLTGFRNDGGYGGDSHSWNGLKGNAGTRTPVSPGFRKYADGTEYMPGGKVRCQTCHSGMKKDAEENIEWLQATDAGDHLHYTVLGYSGTKQYLAKYVKVYRSGVALSKPLNSRTRKLYLVDPAEYAYKNRSALVTFISAQDPADYIYVDVPQPYLRVTNNSNIACLDCHSDRGDDRVMHDAGDGSKDNHPAAVSYGHNYGLNNSLKASPGPKVYIENGQVLCTSCHDPHNSESSDGQILRDADGSSLCGECHDVSFQGYTGKVANHNGARHRDNNRPPTVCLDCHTPHNSRNVMLVRDTVKGKNIIFRNLSGPESFGTDTGDGLCEACHSPSSYFPVTYHRSDGGGPGHRPGSRCMDCHKHELGFAYVLDCAGCHAIPPVSPSGMVTTPTPTGSTEAGAHGWHANVKGYACSTCHSGGMTGGEDTDHEILVSFSFNGYTSGIYDGQTSLINGYFYNAPNTAGGTMECSGIYCHGSTLSPDGGADTAPAWNSTVACGDCHGAATVSPPTRGSHPLHSGDQAGQMRYGCTSCHNNYQSSHVNARSEVSFSSSDPRTAFGVYSGTSQVLDAYGRCRNVYCHSDGKSGDAPFTGRKAPTWGGSADCGDCHNADLAHGQGYSTMSSGSHTKHVTTRGYGCSDCHSGSGSGTVKHADRVVNIGISKTLGPQAVTGTFTGQTTPGSAYGRCSGVYCHSNASPLGGVNDYSTVRWGGTMTCGSCHGHSGASNTMSPSHAKHIDMYSLACGKCHDMALFDANHVDGEKEVTFDTQNPAGTYARPDCTGLYCHSDGGGTGSAVWNGSQTTCTSCHRHNASYTPMSSGAHTAHVNNGYVACFSCSKCHRLTVADDDSTIIHTYHKHVDSTKDVYLTTFNSYTGSYGTDKTCRNAYCHSSGQPSPVFRITPAWDGASTLDCDGCHGSDDYYSLPAGFGAPDYQNLSTAGKEIFNGHQKHVASGPDCYNCHSTTVDGSGQSIAAGGKHINGSREVSFASGGSYDPSVKRCAGTEASGCHGPSILRWGGAASCEDCHTTTGSETDNYVYNNGTKATINLQEWTSTGHGRKGAYRYTGKPGADKGCSDCHTASTPHGASTNPFRLVSSASVRPGQPDTLCMQTACHSGAGNHDFAHVSKGTWSWTPKCVDCHDPHGDPGGLTTYEYNGAMVHSRVAYTGSDAYGIPSDGTVEAVDFPANFERARSGNMFNWSSFVGNTTNKGVCRVCHTQPSTDHFTRSLHSAHNSAGGSCTTCHAHPGGFAPPASYCASCHGMNNGVLVNSGAPGYKNWTTIEAFRTFEGYSGGGGAHYSHVSRRGYQCKLCHYDGGDNNPANHHNLALEVQRQNVDVGIDPKYWFNNWTATYNKTSRNCYNVQCHYGTSQNWDCEPLH